VTNAPREGREWTTEWGLLVTAEGNSVNIDSTLLLIIIPILVIQLGLLIWGLYDLTRPERKVKGDSKVLWALVIIFVNIIGPIIYFLFGRDEA
jgi:membrane-anchored protein YejM (alkaline phosphatase superfamily)